MPLPRRFPAKCALAAGATAMALAVSTGIWSLAARPFSKPPRRHNYGIRFVDALGRQISRQRGQVELMLDPFCVFRLRPEQNDSKFTVDHRGFRRTAATPSKNKPTVAVLGGSTAFGYLLRSDDATFAWQLGDRLDDVAILNAGCPGHLSGQELATMVHYVDAERPVAYVVFDGWNEVVDQDITQPRHSSQFGFNNAFFMMQDRLFEHHRRVDPRNRSADRPIDRGALPDVDSAAYQLELAQQYVANIERMHGFAKARGAAFLVVFQPELAAKQTKSALEDRQLRTWDRAGYVRKRLPEKYRALIQYAEQQCRTLGINCLNLLDDPHFTTSTEELYFDPVHLNERGHRIATNRIAPRLADILRTERPKPSLAN